MLPDAVLQGMGWQPPPVDPSFASQFDPSLHPAVLQGMGLPPPAPAAASTPSTPPPAPPPAPPLDPTLPQIPPDLSQPKSIGGPGAQLPSAAGSTSSPPVPAPDFKLPVPGTAGPSAAAKPVQKPGAPAQPQRPPSVEQQMLQNQAQLGQATQEEKAAVGAQTQAESGQAQEALQAQEQNNARLKELQGQAAAQREEANKQHLIASQDIANRMKAIDDYKVDANKYWNDIGIGGHIGWYVGLALSQLGNTLQGKGGENPVLGMLQNKMKESIQLQIDKRDQMEKGVERAQGAMKEGDLFQAKRAADIAAAEADATKMLKSQIDLATARAQDPLIRANGMAASAKLDRQLAVDTGNAIDKRASYLTAQQNANTASAAQYESARHNKFEEGFQVYKEQQDAQLKAAAIAAKQAGKLSEEESKRAIFVPGPNGQPVAATKKNGDVVLAADPADAAKIRRQVASSSTYNVLVNQMIRGIATHGGESDFWHSKDWQDMKTDYKAAVAELHEAYGVQSFREPTIEFFDNMTSAGLDPTKFNIVREDASEALRNSNRNIQTKMNGLIGAQGYDGAPITWKDTSSPPPVEPTSYDKDLKALLGRPSDAKPQQFDAAGRPLPVDTSLPSDAEQRGAVVQNRLLDQYAQQLRSADPVERNRAATFLEKAANDADDNRIRDRAQQILANNINPDEGGTAPTIGRAPARVNATTMGDEGTQSPLHPDVRKALGLR